MQITHLGHACLLVETDGARLLLDPGVFSSGWEELTDLDAVLFTHAHPDHVDTAKLPVLLESNDTAVVRAEPELAASLAEAGLGQVVTALHPGEAVDVGGVRIEAAGGRHALIHPEIPVIGNIGLLISAPGEPRFFHPGDSYAATPAGVDVLALPLSAPWATSAMTIDFLRAVAPTTAALPVHDALLSGLGRATYLRNLGALVEGVDVRDDGGRGVTSFR